MFINKPVTILKKLRNKPHVICFDVLTIIKVSSSKSALSHFLPICGTSYSTLLLIQDLKASGRSFNMRFNWQTQRLRFNRCAFDSQKVIPERLVKRFLLFSPIEKKQH